MNSTSNKFLDTIHSPTDLKKLREEDLPVLCEEVRSFIIEILSSNPGHLGASLGAIELAVALHYVFNTPYDKLVWDVGHQAYAHKILTGRKEQFHTIRTYHGLSGFPRTSESPYDSFGTGHSSTSISAALGMAIASKLKNEKNRQHIAVIGDGSLTGGMAFEALNHAGISNSNILVILNDNGIAIDKNVGAIKEYLTDITASKTYNKLKEEIWNALGGISRFGPNTRSLIQKFETAIKSSLLKNSNLFESMKMRYFGPVDGHDVNRLVQIMSDLKEIPGPKILHCITVKGKGFEKAEKNQIQFHAPGIFDKETGEIIAESSKHKAPKYQHVFGDTIVELAEQNEKIVGITPAMATGCSLNIMMGVMPKRTFDVGIAEQHAVTFSAGLAMQGFIPFCNIYSSFLQRAYDQIIHDVALQNLSVVFCIDRSGIVGEDGATHHGVFDLSFLRPVPNMIISAPMNEEELRNLMYTAQLKNRGPFAIRYPKGRGATLAWKAPFTEIPIGKGRKIKEGKDIAFISIGHVGNHVIKACELLLAQQVNAAHYDMRFLKPIDEEMLHEIFSRHSRIITVEDGAVVGGLGSAVVEFAAEHQYKATIKKLGAPDRFIEQGTQEELYKECGYDADGIANSALTVVNKKIS